MRTFLCVTLVLFSVACGNQANGTPHGEDEAQANAPADIPSNALVGNVLETFDSAGYTYLRLDTQNGEVWAAVSQVEMEIGRQVAIGNAMLMEDFESPSLGRTFERIVFGSLVGGMGGGTAPQSSAMPPAGMPMGGGSSSAPSSAGPIEVEKAANGLTIAEIFAQKADLAGQEVTVRAQVVKFNAQIMGKNWLHLQDGSGSTETGDHDITVTTQDSADVGVVVTVRGTVVLDKDFGAGYRYALLLEEAVVQP